MLAFFRLILVLIVPRLSRAHIAHPENNAAPGYRIKKERYEEDKRCDTAAATGDKEAV
jgi:hypothetical protein